MWVEDILTGKQAYWCQKYQKWYIIHYLNDHLFITIREYSPRTRIKLHTPF